MWNKTTHLSSRLRVKLIFILFFTATGTSSALSTSYLAEIKDSKLTHRWNTNESYDELRYSINMTVPINNKKTKLTASKFSNCKLTPDCGIQLLMFLVHFVEEDWQLLQQILTQLPQVVAQPWCTCHKPNQEIIIFSTLILYKQENPLQCN